MISAVTRPAGILLLLLCQGFMAFSQPADSLHNNLREANWNYHFQFTGIMQGHPDFQAAYTGRNSMSTAAEQDFSVTTTLFLGRRLWKGAGLYFNPEIAGGKGMSSTLGIAGFPNGECFRIGDPSPTLYIGRIFIRQHFSLSKTAGSDTVSTDLNQLGNERVPSRRITLTAGKFSLADIFDNNACSHDPRTQFMNWALMSNGAWDYPANTRGYTWGFALEFVIPGYAIRFAETTEPLVANGSEFDWNVTKARGETLELEKDFSVKGKKGAVRLLLYQNQSRAGSYRKAINNLLSGVDTLMNVNTQTTYGGIKYGVGLNADQALTENATAFLRAGWNDGQSASWAFTEIDQTLSGGITFKGKRWKRPNDIFGIAGIVNGISKDHWDFLNYGGYGFLIGDGKLPHYGTEEILETYYSAQITKSLWLSADYQYVQNPAYNRDRGPINVWALRAHVQF